MDSAAHKQSSPPCATAEGPARSAPGPYRSPAPPRSRGPGLLSVRTAAYRSLRTACPRGPCRSSGRARRGVRQRLARTRTVGHQAHGGRADGTDVGPGRLRAGAGRHQDIRSSAQPPTWMPGWRSGEGPRASRTAVLRVLSMPLPATPRTRRGLLRESCSQVRSGGAFDCRTSRCSGRSPGGRVRVSGTWFGARVRF